MLPKNLDFASFVNLIDKIHDEILIYDNNYNVLYVNSACERHYGLTQEEFLKISYFDAVTNYRAWSNSVLPFVYRHKCAIKQYQQTLLGYKTLCVATPVFDKDGALQYVVISNRATNSEIVIPSLRDLEDVTQNSCFLEDKHSFQGRKDDVVQEMALKISKINVSCLLFGESGTGKSFIAKYIHKHSDRADKPFVVVSCPNIPTELFEAELFGHKKGAFSGALTSHEGLFAQAKGGTIFLDEISDLALPMQAKLLHVLQEKEYRPVGSSKMISTDVRIIAATNSDLQRMVDYKLFRQDLFFRLNVFDIVIPPLRERKNEIIDFAYYFLGNFTKIYGKSLDFSPIVLSLMSEYLWPGNVRELQNMIERMVIIANGASIDPHHLPRTVFAHSQISVDNSLPSKKKYLCKSKKKNTFDSVSFFAAYNQYKTSRKLAKALGVSQSTATRLIRKYVQDIDKEK